MLRAAKEVKLKHKSIRSLAKEFGIPDRTLTRFCSKVKDGEINGADVLPSTIVGFYATRKVGKFSNIDPHYLRNLYLL